jgi:hypothetical protein
VVFPGTEREAALRLHERPVRMEAPGLTFGRIPPVELGKSPEASIPGDEPATRSLVQRLQALAPDRPLDPWFIQIVEAGTGKVFKSEDNARWTEMTRPILEAFFHARYLLEMAVRYSELQAPPRVLPSGYAALLCLFGLR